MLSYAVLKDLKDQLYSLATKLSKNDDVNFRSVIDRLDAEIDQQEDYYNEYKKEFTKMQNWYFDLVEKYAEDRYSTTIFQIEKIKHLGKTYTEFKQFVKAFDNLRSLAADANILDLTEELMINSNDRNEFCNLENNVHDILHFMQEIKNKINSQLAEELKKYNDLIDLITNKMKKIEKERAIMHEDEYL